MTRSRREVTEREEYKEAVYNRQKDFIVNLSGKRKRMFDELLFLDLREAKYVERHFCLNGEERLTPQGVAEFFGLSSEWNMSIEVTARIDAVLLYLGYQMRAKVTAKKQLEILKRSVERERRRHLERSFREAMTDLLCEEFRFASLPEGFPVMKAERRESLTKLLKASEEMIILRRENRKLFKIVMERFGLYNDWRYKTLQEVGDMFGVTSVSVHWAEKHFLSSLNNEKDSES